MNRTLKLDVLDDIRVASPCPMDWDRMVGDEKRRFCEHCGLHVHNLGAMTREEAMALLAQASGGRVCARFYRRADGKVLTRDCPVGLAAARAKLVRACGRIAAALGLLLSGGWLLGRPAEGSRALSSMEPFATVREWLRPGASNPGQVLILGDVCPPSPAPRRGSTGP
jgi:hypothetical protein